MKAKTKDILESVEEVGKVVAKKSSLPSIPKKRIQTAEGWKRSQMKKSK